MKYYITKWTLFLFLQLMYNIYLCNEQLFKTNFSPKKTITFFVAKNKGSFITQSDSLLRILIVLIP